MDTNQLDARIKQVPSPFCEASLHKAINGASLSLYKFLNQNLTAQVVQGKENLRLSEVANQNLTAQVVQGKENLRLSEVANQNLTAQVVQGNENLRLSEVANQDLTAQVVQGKENLRLSEISLVELSEQSLHDPLTSLPNRRFFNDKFAQAISLSIRNNCYSVLMFLDVNNFKSLNDTYGHVTGDAVLIKVAERLKSCIRDSDTAARFGGDEFAVILSNLDTKLEEAREQAHDCAEKIRATLLLPYPIADRNDGAVDATAEHLCTVSMGVVLFLDKNIEQKAIIRLADTAMYYAKNSGGNSICYSEHESD